MKHIPFLLICLLTLALPAIAQKGRQDSTKMLCRFWIIDSKAMKVQLKANKEETSEEILRVLEKFDVYVHFNANGKVKTNQNFGSEKEDNWSFSPAKKSFIINENQEFIIKALNNKQLVFVSTDDPSITYYLIAPKKNYKLRKMPPEKIKSEPPSYPKN